jgi:hypothetical protein
MAFIVYLALGMCVLGFLLALDRTSNKKLDRKIKGKNISMPNLEIMFGNKKKRR